MARLLDGAFVYSGGIYGGTRASMGPSAVLRIGAFQVLVTSRPTYEWKTEQFEAAGLDPLQAKFIGVKNPMNFNYAYAGISKGALVVDTPGPTPASVRHLPYQRMKRPFFPLDPGHSRTAAHRFPVGTPTLGGLGLNPGNGPQIRVEVGGPVAYGFPLSCLR